MGRAWPEETETKPKPMVDVGGRPVLWHIMKHYAQFGPNEFVVVLGYKGEYVKRYFADCRALQGHIRVNLAKRCRRERERSRGLHRLHRWNVPVTNGDGVSNIDLSALLAFHRRHGKLATLTAVRPPTRFGHLDIENDQIVESC